MASRPPRPLACPSQEDLDAFLRAGVDILALATPIGMRVAVGGVAHDGLFEPDPDGERWVAFEQPFDGDIVFWNRNSGRLCTWCGRTFALGQELIDEPATYSFDCNLNIFADPLEWLRAKRDGIVILAGRWADAFDRLRDCPRVAVDQRLLSLFNKSMKPARLPEVFVITTRRAAA